MLQFITNTSSSISVTQQIKEVVAGGCRWVQIRMKEATDDEIRQVVSEVKELCKETGTILVLDDRVELVKELELDGVHLGKNDMLPSQARTILGANAIIGVTANTIDDVVQVRYLDVDYIGMGPFRFTETKKNLAPVIGLDGYAKMMSQIAEMQIELPVVAIGGITIADVEAIMHTGVNGVAISGEIALSDDITHMTQEFLKLLRKPNKIV